MDADYWAVGKVLKLKLRQTKWQQCDSFIILFFQDNQSNFNALLPTKCYVNNSDQGWMGKLGNCPKSQADRGMPSEFSSLCFSKSLCLDFHSLVW